jgi:hypothetical protein
MAGKFDGNDATQTQTEISGQDKYDNLERGCHNNSLAPARYLVGVAVDRFAVTA